MHHEEFANDLAAYALDALDTADRAALEAHLATCPECAGALAELRQASLAVGLSTEPVAPPAGLRSRTLAHAMAGQLAVAAEAPVPPRQGSPVPWLLAAAAALVAALSLGYTLALRSELSAAQRASRTAAAQVQALEAELAGVRDGVTRLERVVDVVTAPDARQVRLSGTGEAAASRGVAYLSPSLGLVVHATSLPALAPGQGYQLWLIPPGAQPVSLGMMSVSGATASRAASLPAGVTTGVIALTVEAASGSPSGQPTSTPVLVGN